MSHLETATFGGDGEEVINVPTSGFTEEGTIDPRLAVEILQQRGWTPIPGLFQNKEEGVEAAKKTSKAWGETHKHDSNFLQKVMEPFIEGAKHSYSSIAGDVSKGKIGNILSKGVFPLLGGFAHNTIKVPAQAVDVKNMIYQKLPEVTPMGSFMNHPVTQQKIDEIIPRGITGTMTSGRK